MAFQWKWLALLLVVALAGCSGERASAPRRSAPAPASPAPASPTPASPAPEPVGSEAPPPPPPAPGRGSHRRLHPPVGDATALAATGNPSEDAAEEAWFASLKNGKIDWDVPPRMVVGETKPVTVRIHGYMDSGAAVPNATGTQQVKVSTQMRAEMMSASGDDLTVAPLDARSQKYVPATGSTDWSWNVTPNHSGENKMLKLTVSVVMNGAPDRSFEVYSKPFSIEAVSVGQTINFFEDHFLAIVKYFLLPGSGGFLIIGGMIEWWRRRPGKQAAANAAANKNDIK